jgi:Spy/CpxP family protein refolding chaperone
MTSIADSGPKAGWRGRLLWIALALSLTLNVCFVGGLVWTKMALHPPMGPIERIQRVGQALDLNDSQRIAFDQFVRVLRLRGRFIRETNQPLLQELWGEIAKPTPDDATVAQLGDQINANRATLQKEASAALSDFIKTLTPEQRTKMAGVITAPGDEPTRRVFQMIVP